MPNGYSAAFPPVRRKWLRQAFRYVLSRSSPNTILWQPNLRRLSAFCRPLRRVRSVPFSSPYGEKFCLTGGRAFHVRIFCAFFSCSGFIVYHLPLTVKKLLIDSALSVALKKVDRFFRTLLRVEWLPFVRFSANFHNFYH